ncbi:MAG: phage portal protein [Phycisphaerales bacterium]|nr:MAG: phage portal protein [Phycisphaerales bacterium]
MFETTTAPTPTPPAASGGGGGAHTSSGWLDDTALDDALAGAIESHERTRRPQLERYWRYYRNAELGARPGAHPNAGSPDLTGQGTRPRLAQEQGLPDRITGGSAERAARREVVVENDIAWRVHAQVDFMFGKPVAIRATGADLDDAERRRIERVLDMVWEASGGVALLQDVALLGHVYGYVDLAVRADAPGLRALALSVGSATPDDAVLRAAAELVRIEPIEPTRGVPLLDPGDYRRLLAYAVTYERERATPPARAAAPARHGRLFGRVREAIGAEPARGRRERSRYTEVIGPHDRRVFEDGREVMREAHDWAAGRPPVVHVQNVSQPFRYEGLGEVEPLIPLQDELNTRLSDRASRVTMQSFKMYLARGIEGFDRVPVAPGTVWTTDNPDASVEAFGGDADSPSEESHLQQIREALDKVSGVPPLASGVVRARIGNLTSANALRITLMGLLSKTARKRVTYGAGMARVSALVLAALDATGVLPTAPEGRGVRLDWPDPLPVDLRERAADARTKLELGVPRERVLRELGFTSDDPGVQ